MTPGESAGKWANGSLKFDTSSEASYPQLLAQHAASCLVEHASSANWSLSKQPRLHDLATASLNKQSKKHKPLIPEYHHVNFQPKQDPIKQGSKIIAPHLGGVGREEETSGPRMFSSDTVKVGHFHTPKQFISMAKTVEHPMDAVEHLEDATLFSLDFNLRYPMHLTKIERKKNLLQAKIMARKLEQDEKALHSGLPKCLEKVLGGKNLLLWRDLLAKYQYDDMGVVDFMLKGVPLVGVHDTPS